MIGFLRGIVFAIGLDYILLDVNNVGYRINFVNRNLKVGQEALIYTYQNVKEDEISLFGFSTLAEYDLFVKLLSV
ncbi:MAG: Holliday junction branch migration protein RuvA, partial [Erysipelotrichaceae bacterium]|nr:Holliday junction branch migration protein RuvA [Erysipelotrichaceae bacterium]